METVEKAERSREIRKTPRQKSRCHSLSAASPVICAGTGHPIVRPIYRSGDARLSPYQEEGEALLMKAYERFLHYVAFDTTSDESNPACPSTPGQMTLANALAEELLSLGLADARVDEHGYVYASLPAHCETRLRRSVSSLTATPPPTPAAPVSIPALWSATTAAISSSTRKSTL